MGSYEEHEYYSSPAQPPASPVALVDPHPPLFARTLVLLQHSYRPPHRPPSSVSGGHAFHGDVSVAQFLLAAAKPEGAPFLGVGSGMDGPCRVLRKMRASSVLRTGHQILTTPSR